MNTLYAGSIGQFNVDIGRGYLVVVDFDIWERFRCYRWSAQVHRKRGIVYAAVLNTLLHRLVMNTSTGQLVDHINRNTLDCRRSNLRFVTPGQNRANSGRDRDNSSGYKGVSRANRKWAALIVVAGVRHYLGVFEHKERAAQAVDRAAIHFHGEHAGLNFEHLRATYRPWKP